MVFMRGLAGAAALGAAMLIGGSLFATAAQAGYLVTLMQQGSSVVANGSGAIDLTGLRFTGVGSNYAGMYPTGGAIVTGPTFPNADLYGGFTGPTSFGIGGAIHASSGSGDTAGIVGAADFLGVPVGYGSGNSLSDTATYDNATFASLGVTPGIYEWTWGTGADQNFTLDIKSSNPVPEPGSLLLLATALAGLGFVGWRRRRA